MNSHLTQVILATLGAYLFILILFTVYDWIAEEFPSRPVTPTVSERIQHPFYHHEAVGALRQFSRLPETEKNAVKQGLSSNLILTRQWLTHLRESDIEIMCMGELHEESTRQFLSNEFFANVCVDVLLLETTPEALDRFSKRMIAGRDYFPMLGADIMSILRTVRARNPDVRIYGIEETDEQQKQQKGVTGSRDRSIARNFWSRYQPGRRHIIIFGALHCTNEANWLYQNLSNQALSSLQDKMLNVLVVEEHQNGPVEAFVYFLDGIGMERTGFVIADTGKMDDRIYEWFPLLDQQILEKYRTLIVFRR